MAWNVAIDIGGTFTDIVCLDTEDGSLLTAKVPSTPPHYIGGVMSAIEKVGISAADVNLIIHGSTVAINTVLERKGARTGLLLTSGFRDVLIVGRAHRPEPFDLSWDPPKPLVPRRDTLVITERVDYEGRILEPLKEEEVRQAAAVFKRRGMDAIAVCFINSFMNPAHEIRAKEIISEIFPEVYVTASHEINPDLREFERASTTVVNAYIGPVVNGYLSKLKQSINAWGCQRDILITHSAGGVMTCKTASLLPAWTLLGGRSCGVMGAAHIGELAGFQDIITYEMGGTSCDVCIVRKKEPLVTTQFDIEFTIPVRRLSLDSKCIGSGGGSIAWIDTGGVLRVGPQSAGASPGPACYGSGGDQPTVTDAQLLLRRLNPRTFLGGQMALSEGLARNAIERKIASHFGWKPEDAAAGILKIAKYNMVDALRLVTVKKGLDPRDFAMIAFGGAGPMHAAEIARELSIKTAIIPDLSGLMSSFGSSFVDVKHDFIKLVYRREREIDVARLNQIYTELEKEAIDTLRMEGIAGEKMSTRRFCDMRYFGQVGLIGYIPVPDGVLDETNVGEIVRAFLDRHQQEFGYKISSDAAQVELANARVIASGFIPKPRVQKFGRGGSNGEAFKGVRGVYFEEAGQFVQARIYDKEKLFPGARIDGPAIVEHPYTTAVLPPGSSAEVDDYLSLIMSV